MKNTTTILLILLLSGMSIYAGSQLFPRYITNTQLDTVKTEVRIEIPIEKIVYKHLPAKLETTWLPINSGRVTFLDTGRITVDFKKGGQSQHEIDSIMALGREQDSIYKVTGWLIPDVTASLDTVVQTDSIYSDTLHVKYHFPPKNFFDFSLGLQTRQTFIENTFVTKTVEVEKTKFFDSFVGGVVKDVGIFALGYLVCDLTHKNTGQNIEYKYPLVIPLK